MLYSAFSDFDSGVKTVGTNPQLMRVYNIVKWCVGDLKQEKSENNLNCRKIIHMDFRRIKSVL